MVPQHMIEVLIMAPGHGDRRKPAVRRVYAERGAGRVRSLSRSPYLFIGSAMSGFFSNCSVKTMAGEGAQPVMKVSPTVDHCGWPHTAMTLPRSWRRPVSCIHSAGQQRRAACIR